MTLVCWRSVYSKVFPGSGFTPGGGSQIPAPFFDPDPGGVMTPDIFFDPDPGGVSRGHNPGGVKPG